jgi:hypothetical protein
MNNLYALQRIERALVDEVNLFIIAAENELCARSIAGDLAGKEGHATWMNETLAQCTFIAPVHGVVENNVILKN